MTVQHAFTCWHRIRLGLILSGTMLMSGCASDGQVDGAVYVGVGAGYYEPWYWGGCCSDDVDIDIDNEINIGPRPEHPIAHPPGERPVARPLPSGPGARPAPAAPRPAAMPRGGGGRRR